MKALVSKADTPAQSEPPRRVGRDALQAAADESPRVRAAASWQALATSAVQRQVDTSPSPYLPAYAEGETPAWQDEQGVPDWAKEGYRSEARRTLICSMTPDGKIGSVYFPEGRIRTTHAAGPAKEGHSHHITLQFNLDEPAAIAVFEKNVLKRPIGSETDWSLFDRWLVRSLEGAKPAQLPTWATLVEGPETAHEGRPPDELKLFEIFKKVGGAIAGWHPSRGAATKFLTDKQTIAVLEAAIAHLESNGIEDPKARNVAFYDFVVGRLPRLAEVLRQPSEV
ncbi:MAG: hypothetical protein EA356_03410 [Geminicoccaceae bacterium]|nr:MAG: hypothetical protein EA356_03410 [Geminicoccaceae bacterium]